jgi:hypothetical protein
MKLKTILASMVAVCLLSSCDDLFEDTSMQPDGSNPSLTVSNPTNNQTLLASQGLRIKITAVDKDKLNDIDFKVKSASGEGAFLDFKKFPEKTVVEFDTTVALSGVAPGTYSLLISATDNRTNNTLQEVKFTVR